jgi:hypothetical protein
MFPPIFKLTYLSVKSPGPAVFLSDIIYTHTIHCVLLSQLVCSTNQSSASLLSPVEWYY